MTTDSLPTGPDQESITLSIRQVWPDTDVVTTTGASFFSLDPEKHWPNFATIVSTDDFDTASNLSRPGIFRLNIGLGRVTFQRLVGSIAEPAYAALDRLLPHPVYCTAALGFDPKPKRLDVPGPGPPTAHRGARPAGGTTRAAYRCRA